MDSKMEREQWTAAVREEEKVFGFSPQRFIGGDMNEFVQDMDGLLVVPRSVNLAVYKLPAWGHRACRRQPRS
jgi:hypothetical protein